MVWTWKERWPLAIANHREQFQTGEFSKFKTQNKIAKSWFTYWLLRGRLRGWCRENWRKFAIKEKAEEPLFPFVERIRRDATATMQCGNVTNLLLCISNSDWHPAAGENTKKTGAGVIRPNSEGWECGYVIFLPSCSWFNQVSGEKAPRQFNFEAGQENATIIAAHCQNLFSVNWKEIMWSQW